MRAEVRHDLRDPVLGEFTGHRFEQLAERRFGRAVGGEIMPTGVRTMRQAVSRTRGSGSTPIRRSPPVSVVAVAAWCAERGIARTRGRPGKSGDQAHVEQRNRTFVRALAGDLRFEGAAARNALAALYAPAIDFANFFDARARLLEKARSGRRVTRRYDRARTPHERLAGSGVLDPGGLRRQEIDRGIDGLIRFAARPQ